MVSECPHHQPPNKKDVVRKIEKKLSAEFINKLLGDDSFPERIKIEDSLLEAFVENYTEGIRKQLCSALKNFRFSESLMNEYERIRSHTSDDFLKKINPNLFSLSKENNVQSEGPNAHLLIGISTICDILRPCLLQLPLFFQEKPLEQENETKSVLAKEILINTVKSIPEMSVVNPETLAEQTDNFNPEKLYLEKKKGTYSLAFYSIPEKSEEHKCPALQGGFSLSLWGKIVKNIDPQYFQFLEEKRCVKLKLK